MEKQSCTILFEGFVCFVSPAEVSCSNIYYCKNIELWLRGKEVTRMQAPTFATVSTTTDPSTLYRSTDFCLA
jgi:hypothetical protein